MTPDQIKEAIRREIIGVINANDWTQARAAQAADVSSARIWEVVAGRIERWSIERLVTLASRLGIDTSVAFGTK